jgi:hypothetical protein
VLHRGCVGAATAGHDSLQQQHLHRYKGTTHTCVAINEMQNDAKISFDSHRCTPSCCSCCENSVEAAQLLLAGAETCSYCCKQDTTCSEAAVTDNQRLAAAGDTASCSGKSAWRHLPDKSFNVINNV